MIDPKFFPPLFSTSESYTSYRGIVDNGAHTARVPGQEGCQNDRRLTIS